MKLSDARNLKNQYNTNLKVIHPRGKIAGHLCTMSISLKLRVLRNINSPFLPSGLPALYLGREHGSGKAFRQTGIEVDYRVLWW